MTKEILFGLINALVPDQPGQVVRPAPGGEVWLNPQPLPPRAAQQDAWRSVAVARAIISMAAFSMNAGRSRDEGMRSAHAMVEAFVDDFCGTGPSVPLPHPWPRLDVKANALDVVIAAAQFHSASTALKDHPLSGSLAAGADRMLDAALRKLVR